MGEKRRRYMEMAEEIVEEIFERKREWWREWKTVNWFEEGPCDDLADSIDDALVSMFEAITTFEIGLDKHDEKLMRKAISDIEIAKSRSEDLWKSAISVDKRLEKLFPKPLHDVLLRDLDDIKELMEVVLLKEIRGEKAEELEELEELVTNVDGAWKIPLWKLYCECRKWEKKY